MMTMAWRRRETEEDSRNNDEDLSEDDDVLPVAELVLIADVHEAVLSPHEVVCRKPLQRLDSQVHRD
jgi:hypothetical protein